jgi:hypothetical protein
MAEPNAPNVVAQLAIILDDRGQLSVTGPIDNKMLAYGMLELAKDVIYERGKEAERRIKLAPASMAGMLKQQ